MPGFPDDSSSPPDWPEPGAPLPEEEPTIELPAVTQAMLAADASWSTPTLATAALSMALTRPEERRARRVPALARIGRPARRTPAPEPDPVPGDPDEDTAPAAPTLDDLIEPAETPAEPSRRWLVGAGIAAAALLLTGATVVVLSRDGGVPAADTTGWSPPVAVAANGHTATAALDGRTTASFDVIDGAKRVTVRAADLGESLYRVSTPEDGTVVPRTEEQDGRVQLRLDGDAASVDITLNAAVLWDLRVAGGAELSTIDLSGGRVGGVDLTGGASRINLTLPRPDGTLSVRMSGGVSLFDVRTAGEVPVRIRVGSGAGQVTVDGQLHAGVAAGQIFTPVAWGESEDRIDVDAAAGMSAMTVAPY